jgi:Rieske Fe-S protein
MKNRRAFIKESCTLCMGIMGMGTIISALSACATMPVFKGEIEKNIITVPISSFTETNNMVIVRNNQLPFDVILIKQKNGNFIALEMKCTHQDNPLTVSKTGLFCASHGSAFDLEGNVVKEPALVPLKKYKTEMNNAVVQILM